MPKNVVITPLSGLVDFYDAASNLDAKIQIDDAGSLNISNSGGTLVLGNAAANVYIGDGTNSVDVIFEQNGAIRALTGKTLTLGNSASNIAVQSPLTINSQILNTTTTGYFEVRQTVSSWGNSTSHPIIKWDYNATYDDHLYLASGGNASGTTQTALVVTENAGVVIGAGPSSPNSSSIVSTEWFRFDNSRFTISRNATQYLTFENSDTTTNPIIISYTATNNAKPIIFDSKTDAVNTAPTAGTLGYEFRVNGTSALTVNTDRTITTNTNLSVGGTLSVTGNLTVNGTTTTVNSTTVTVDDPIFTLGGDTAPTVDDNKDRGVEFRWHNGTAAKVGFFGFDDSTGYLTFIPDATNTSEVFSGTMGDIQATNFRGALIGNASTATNVAWSGITSKPTTLSGFGITDAFSSSGGTTTGNITISTVQPVLILRDTDNFGTGVGQTGWISFQDSAGTERAWIGYGSSGSTDFNISNSRGQITAGGNIILTAGNYNSYSPTLTGTGATGSWAISVTSAANQSSSDDRIKAPADDFAANKRFGFTSWNNNNTAPYADYLHLRSYTDSSGGNDNLVMFRKDALGMRIWQQTYGSATAYSTFKDVAWTDGTNSTGTWGISVTGSAGSVAWTNVSGRPTTVSSFTNDSGYITSAFSGFMLRSTSVQANPNTNFVSSAYRFDPNANNPTNEHYAIVTYGNESNVVGQLATHFTSGQTFTRAYNSAWSSWRTLLDSTNYNSYSPTLTGTGASGTWSINVTGSAGSAGSVAWTNVSGRPSTIAGLLGTDSVSANPNVRLGSGYYQNDAASSANNWPVGSSSWWHLHSVTHSNTANYYSMQFAADFYANNLYYRSTNGSAATSWSRVLLDTNYNSYSPTLTGTGASGTWGISITGSASSNVLKSGDTMSGDLSFSNGRKGLVGVYNASQTQAVFAMGSSYRLTDGGASNVYGDFYGMAWSYDPDYGGAGNNPQSKAGLAHQLLIMNAGVTRTAIGNGIWTSGAISQNGNQVLHAGNYTSYSPSLTGSGASGTWGINVTGNSATTSQRTFSNVRTDGINRGSYGAISIAGSSGSYSGIDFTDASVTFMVRTSDQLTGVYKNNSAWLWYFDGSGVLQAGSIPQNNISGGNLVSVLQPTHGDSGRLIQSLNASAGNAVQFYIEHNLANVAIGNSRGNINIAAGSLLHGGNQVLHAGNYTSYSPSLTGSGASGTWGISITGNAATATTASNTTAVAGYDISWGYVAGAPYYIWGTASGTGTTRVYAASEVSVGTATYSTYVGSSSLWTTGGQDLYGRSKRVAVASVGNVVYNYGGDFTNAEIQSSLLVTGNVTAYSSDRRLKTNVKPIDNALTKISKLSGFTFNWNDTAKTLAKYDTEKVEVGVFAQDVLEVQPEAVKSAPFDVHYETGQSISGEHYLTVQYDRLVPLLIEAIKECSNYLDKQEARINKLEDMLMSLSTKE